MADTAINEFVNELLITIHRSLVLYVDDVSPWASDEAVPLQQEVTALANRQHADVGQLVSLLSSRDVAVDFAVYPPEFTSLHFVSLDYLAEHLIDGQRALVARLETAADELATDAEAQAVVQKVAASQREGLVRLLAAAPSK